MEKTVKISILRIKREFKMEKTVKISILGRKREFKMEKRVKISILRRKKEFKMEKTAEIFILGRKREFKMEKTVKISILELRYECTLNLQYVIIKTPLCQKITRKSSFQRSRFCRIIPNCIREVKKSKQQNAA